MKLFRRRQTPSPVRGWIEAREYLSWGPPGNVIREGHHQDELRQLAGPPREQGYFIAFSVDLIREPKNPYDANAIRAEIAGVLIGWIAKEVAVEVARTMDAAGFDRMTVAGVLRGGYLTADYYGVHVWLDRQLADGPGFASSHLGWEAAWPPHDYDLG